MAKTIIVKNSTISIIEVNKQDYISLTNMPKNFGDDTMIYSWMRNPNTVEFLGNGSSCITLILKVTNSQPLKCRQNPINR